MFSCLRLSSSSLVGTIFELLPVEWRRVFIAMCETFLITSFVCDGESCRESWLGVWIFVSWGSSVVGLGWMGIIFLTATAINFGAGFCLIIWVRGGMTVSAGGFGWICWSFRFDWTRGSFEGYIVIFDVDFAVCHTGTSRTGSYSSSCFSCLISVSGGRFNGVSFDNPLLSAPLWTAAKSTQVDCVCAGGGGGLGSAILKLLAEKSLLFSGK